MPKVLVIGATGFLGLSIAQALRRSSITVYGLTRSSNKSGLLASNEIIPVVGSVEEPASYLEIIEAENIDIVVDASATYQGAHQVLQSLLNVGKMRLQQSESSKSPKLGYIYISGMWIHGNSMKPTNDLASVGLPHSVSQPPKMLTWRPALEREILAASDTLSVAIVRPALMFGKNQSAFGAYFGPIQGAAKANTPKLSIAASKEAMMALVHVDDCAEGVLAVVKNISLVSGPNVYPVFDLMGSYESMYAVMEQAAQIIGFKGTLEYAGPGDDMLAEAMCTTVRSESFRARNLLGWIPKKKGLLEELEVHVMAFLASQEKGH